MGVVCTRRDRRTEAGYNPPVASKESETPNARRPLALRSLLLPSGALPSDPLKVPDGIKMLVLAHERETVLASESRDPKIVGGNRMAGFLQFSADLSVVARGFIIDGQDAGCAHQLPEPLFIFTATSRLPESKAIFPQRDHRQLNTGCLAEDANRCCFIIGDGGKSVGVQNQLQSSGSLPVLRFDPFKLAPDDCIDARRLFVKMFQAPGQPEPRLLFLL